MIIFFVSNPPFAPLLALVSRTPYALLLYDLYPDVLRQLQSTNLITNFLIDIVFLFWNS